MKTCKPELHTVCLGFNKNCNNTGFQCNIQIRCTLYSKLDTVKCAICRSESCGVGQVDENERRRVEHVGEQLLYGRVHTGPTSKQNALHTLAFICKCRRVNILTIHKNKWGAVRVSCVNRTMRHRQRQRHTMDSDRSCVRQKPQSLTLEQSADLRSCAPARVILVDQFVSFVESVRIETDSIRYCVINTSRFVLQL